MSAGKEGWPLAGYGQRPCFIPGTYWIQAQFEKKKQPTKKFNPVLFIFYILYFFVLRLLTYSPTCYVKQIKETSHAKTTLYGNLTWLNLWSLRLSLFWKLLASVCFCYREAGGKQFQEFREKKPFSFTSKKYFLWKKETEKCWATKANEQFSSMASSSAILYHLPLLSRLSFLKVKEILSCISPKVIAAL
jgi:hypothetical protein